MTRATCTRPAGPRSRGAGRRSSSTMTIPTRVAFSQPTLCAAATTPVSPPWRVDRRPPTVAGREASATPSPRLGSSNGLGEASTSPQSIPRSGLRWSTRMATTLFRVPHWSPSPAAGPATAAMPRRRQGSSSGLAKQGRTLRMIRGCARATTTMRARVAVAGGMVPKTRGSSPRGAARLPDLARTRPRAGMTRTTTRTRACALRGPAAAATLRASRMGPSTPPPRATVGAAPPRHVPDSSVGRARASTSPREIPQSGPRGAAVLTPTRRVVGGTIPSTAAGPRTGPARRLGTSRTRALRGMTRTMRRTRGCALRGPVHVARRIPLSPDRRTLLPGKWVPRAPRKRSRGTRACLGRTPRRRQQILPMLEAWAKTASSSPLRTAPSTPPLQGRVGSAAQPDRSRASSCAASAGTRTAPRIPGSGPSAGALAGTWTTRLMRGMTPRARGGSPPEATRLPGTEANATGAGTTTISTRILPSARRWVVCPRGARGAGGTMARSRMSTSSPLTVGGPPPPAGLPDGRRDAQAPGAATTSRTTASTTRESTTGDRRPPAGPRAGRRGAQGWTTRARMSTTTTFLMPRRRRCFRAGAWAPPELATASKAKGTQRARARRCWIRPSPPRWASGRLSPGARASRRSRSSTKWSGRWRPSSGVR
mmetsp:Transcript_33977/g.83514  ORF Transcript_33977/g.83514 Transcript_33977/m.83514 type:complete len:653 (+) Transcript_33977:3844-5802(+)